MAEIPSTAQSSKGVLGEGYNSDAQDFVGECVTGGVSFVGAQNAAIEFSKSMDSNSVASELGFGAGMKAKYGIMTTSGSSTFARSTKATSFSEVTIYRASYTFKNKKLVNVSLTPVGQTAQGAGQGGGGFTYENWDLTCGNEFIDQITLGASLYVCARIEFASREEKTRLTAKFNFKGPAFSASGNIKNASQSIGKRASITITAFQLGGHVELLSQIFSATLPGSGNQASAILRCSMDNPDACLAVFDKAIQYATNTSDPKSFPNQISPLSDFNNLTPGGPAELKYITAPWSDLALYSAPQVVNEAIKQARDSIERLFDFYLALVERIEELRSGTIRLSRRQRDTLLEIERTVQENITLIIDAAIKAYSKPGDAVSIASSLLTTITSVDEDQLDIYPEEFAQWYDLKDLPETLVETKDMIDFLVSSVSSDFNDFAAIEDKGEAVQKRLSESEEIRFAQDHDPSISEAKKDIIRSKTKAEFLTIDSINPFAFYNSLEQIYVIGGRDEFANIDRLGQCTGLKYLFLNPRADVASLDLSWLHNLTELESLSIIGTSRPRTATDNPILPPPKNTALDISSIPDLPNLATLSITALSVGSLVGFPSLKKLKNLELQDASINSLDGLQDFQKDNPTLVELDVRYNNVSKSTDSGYIGHMVSLTSVYW
jgi:hypothetical protein